MGYVPGSATSADVAVDPRRLSTPVFRRYDALGVGNISMRRRTFLGLVGGATATALWPLATLAQPAGKIPRIGWIILGSPAGSVADIFSYYDSFRAGLGDVGYVEGGNIALVA